MALITHAEPEQGRAGYCWVVLAVAFALTFMTLGMRSTLGVFFKAMIDDLGWGRGRLSMVAAVNIWLGGFLTPFIGYVMDRYGARWLFIISSVIFGVGFALVGLSNSVGYLLVVYGLVLALAMAGASVALCNALVAQWFPPHRRGMALGINNSAMAVGQFCLVLVSAQMLHAAGWRMSHIYLGITAFVIMVPMACLIPRYQYPVRRQRVGGQARVLQGPLESEHWGDAVRSTPLWQINGSYFVCGMTVALFTHFIPLATDRGLSTEAAAFIFGMLSVFAVIGALLSGAISDRLGRKNVMGLAYAVRAVAFALLLFWRHDFALYAFAVLAGLSWLATPTAVSALTSEVYGMRALGTLNGIALLVHQIGAGASVWLAGALYDTTGSYDLAFGLGLVSLIVASLVSFGIAERRYSSRYAAV
jgi:MFS family permease